MEAPQFTHGKGVRCPACGNVFSPVLPRAELVDIGGHDARIESSGDADILWPTDLFGPQPPVVPNYGPPPLGPPAPAERLVPLAPLAPAPPGSELQNAGPSAAEALARLAGGAGAPIPGGQGLQDKPEGWFIRSGQTEQGPFTSREVAVKAYRGEIGRDAVLSNYRKNVRVVAGSVPFLFRKPSDAVPGAASGPAAPGAPAPAAPRQDNGEPGWYVETCGKEVGPMTTAQVELAARRGILARDAVLTHPEKGIRVLAGDVPRLFPGDAPAGPRGQAFGPQARPTGHADAPAPGTQPDGPPGPDAALNPLAALQAALATQESTKGASGQPPRQ